MISVEIIGVRGSAPRDAGTVMVVDTLESHGTIGGGALEHRAIATARRMLAEGRSTYEETLPLGPGLGQCCGGAVTLRYAEGARAVDRPLDLPLDPALVARATGGALWLWGAGHVGRAVVRALGPLRLFSITWIDSSAERFPAEVPSGVAITPAADMPRLAAHAPRDAHHLIFTYAHDIDLALCAALLRRGFASCGLIGSATKWARFQNRLRAMQLDPESITCPIGDPARGKHPDTIAHSTATALLRWDAHLHDSAPKTRAAV
ncbi:xanthine dehydrogenase accessory protein XdhC [Marimonas sp. MJW-29]|uniref:Xanthine dehydrogenase accessory protein XdhC n=1 Tax=Sulfitobacter sediminis TaxID=3234186 RepID=A0ABV3RQD4_9RHOB